MKLMQSFLRRSAALASLLLATATPALVYSADQSGPSVRMAPVGTPIQQVNYNCPNGNCNGGGWGGGGWGNGGYGGWRGGSCWGGHCSTCNGVGIFGCPCHHGTANGYAFVRPPAAWPVARTSNVYNYYYSAKLGGAPNGVIRTGMQYPMVYQPTDTAQMGFSYQAVPRWYYRPEMLPPPPAPYWPMGMNGGMGYGGGWAGGAPVDGTTTAPAVAPNATPVTPAPTPPVAPPPPVEPQVNTPDPEATFFPERVRRR